MNILVMAGGTGGHVFPALAVAKELIARGVNVEWLGTKNGIEADLVPQAGIKLNTIDIVGLRGKNIVTWLKLPWVLLRAIWQALGIIKQFKPNVVLGLGGFAAGPGGLAAKLCRKSLVIHEQNAIAGTTNKWLAKISNRRAVGFPNSLPNAEWVGNPVRQAFYELQSTADRNEQNKKQNLLILGGSLGARKLNQLLPAALQTMDESLRPNIWHQTGNQHIDSTKETYQSSGVSAKVVSFIDDIAQAYDWADIVVCRAGALTVAEITASGVAALLVPFPYAIDDHQSKNAQWLVDNDAGILWQENKLTPQVLAKELAGLLSSTVRLNELAKNAQALSMPNAARRVADICLEAANG